MIRSNVSFAVCLLVWAASAAAQVTVDLPLEGWYRPGRYMPVRITIADPSAAAREELVLRGQGVISTSLAVANGKTLSIVPWLPLEAVSAPTYRWRGSDVPLNVPLRALENQQRLVGVASADAAAASGLFPDQQVVTVPLDQARPIPGPAMAWQTLDGVLLDAAAAGRLDELTMTQLASAGTVIAVTGQPPHSRWPWRREGRLWVLRPGIAGPTGATYNASAYRPVGGWVPGSPDATRRQIVFLGVIVSILLLGASLLRHRAAALAVVGVSVVAAAGIAWWSGRQAVVLEQIGEVRVYGDGSMQLDAWRYFAALRPTRTAVDWDRWMRPVLAGRAHAERANIVLRCDESTGPGEISFDLEPGMKLAFLWRMIDRPSTRPPTTMPVTSPLAVLVREQYLRPGLEIAGEAPPEYVDWPTVVCTTRPSQ